MRVEEYVARGLSPDDARQLATRRFGDAERARAGCLTIDEQFARAHGRADLVTALRQDMAFAVRLLRRQGTATLLAVVCLALGIGATTSMFTVADALLLRPMPFPNGDRLMYLGTARGGEHGATSPRIPTTSTGAPASARSVDLAAYRSTSLTVLGDEPVPGQRAGRLRELFPRARRLPGARPALHRRRGFARRRAGGDRLAQLRRTRARRRRSRPSVDDRRSAATAPARRTRARSWV